jgi:hypothetical protein
MLSLREQQQRFAEAILGSGDAALPIGFLGGDDAARVSIYSNNFHSNYRNALRASYPVVCRLVGKAFFDCTVDAFVRARPSTSGDLNLYGGDFGDFLLSYPYAKHLPYLADVARLEWLIDEAQRAPERAGTPEEVLSALAAIAPELLASISIALEPSCGLVASRFPLLHIWRANQLEFIGDRRVELDEGADRLLVRRAAGTVAIEMLGAGTFALLRSLRSGSNLGSAFEAAQEADSTFDLGAALGAHIGAGTLIRITSPVR